MSAPEDDHQDPVAVEIATRPTEADLTSDDSGTVMLTMVRALNGTTTQVWAALTDPTDLARWSPVVPDRALLTPGPATSREHPDDPEVDATVLAVTPDQALVHLWGGSVLGWAIEAHGDVTILTLDQVLEAREQAPAMAAGWHICFAVLAALVDGRPTPRLVGADALDAGWDLLREGYARHFAAITITPTD